jgi:hypothetical protein
MEAATSVGWPENNLQRNDDGAETSMRRKS